mmetsp:Transcript_8842/g.19421  ORF Transcript_8842/g.19421 Transcript_8842/m.19421 type:complete len:208 (-) Transcript_8842:205-828(-)
MMGMAPRGGVSRDQRVARPPARLPERSPQNHANLFSRTKMCKFNAANRCLRGKDCPYAHSVDQLIPLPDLACTKMCRTYLNGGKCVDEACMFAHSKSDVRAPYRHWQRLRMSVAKQVPPGTWDVAAGKMQSRPATFHDDQTLTTTEASAVDGLLVASIMEDEANRLIVKNTFLCVLDEKEQSPSARVRARTAKARFHRGGDAAYSVA